MHLRRMLACRSVAVAILYFLQLTVSSAFSSFSESTLERLVQASSLSYLSMEKMASSPYYEACNLEPLMQVVDSESESGATIFGASDDYGVQQKLIVACRGSANPKNFGTNLKFNLVPATRLSQNYIPDNAMVHEGFQTASVGLWKELSRPLEQLVSSYSEVVFTGHSLGAATALLCATHYNASYKGPSPSVITFGGPKLCNSVLARHLRNEALEGCNILHLVHPSDPVLANNKKLWDSLGFEDVGIELECDPHSPTVYSQGGEKPQKKSPFGNFAWNIVDHCKYMGVFVGPRAFL